MARGRAICGHAAGIVGGCVLFASAYPSSWAFVAVGPGRDAHLNSASLTRHDAATMDMSMRLAPKQSAESPGDCSPIFRAGCAASAFVGALAMRHCSSSGHRMRTRQHCMTRDIPRFFFAPSEDWQEGINAVAATLMRVVAAFLIFHHGMEHTIEGGLPGSNVEAVKGMADFMIKPYFKWVPIFSPYQLVVIRDYCESLGSICLAVGFFTRGAALVLSSTMGAAIYYHLNADGFGAFSFEEPALLFVIFLFFAINGAGPISVDAYVKRFFGA